MNKHAYLGIDGGGSQTRCLITDATGQALAQATTGPSNVKQVASEVLLNRLQTVISSAISQCSQAISIEVSCLGLAGCGSPKMHRQTLRLLQALECDSTPKLILQTDAEIALSGAFPGQSGSILIAGTGSVCFNRDPHGQLHRSGGEGPLLGDRGSASWIARQTIQFALNSTDTAFQKMVCAHFGLDTSALLATIEGKPDHYSNQEIASLCPIICAAAANGNKAAQGIIENASDALLQLVKETHLKAPIQQLALAGSLLTRDTPVAEGVKKALAQDLPNIKLLPAQLSPLQGAVFEAYRYAHPDHAISFANALQKHTL